MNTSTATDSDQERYEQIYREQDDPWDYYSAFEQSKYARMAAAARKWQPTPHRVLEVACSLGYLTEMLADYAPEVHAFDISPIAIERAKLRCAALKSRTEFFIDVGDAIHPNYDPSSFDVVFMGDIVRNLSREEDREQATRSALALLRDNGVLVLTDCMKWRDQARYVAFVERMGGCVVDKFYHHDRYWMKFRSLLKFVGKPAQIRPLLRSTTMHNWLTSLGRWRGAAGSKHFGLVVTRKGA